MHYRYHRRPRLWNIILSTPNHLLTGYWWYMLTKLKPTLQNHGSMDFSMFISTSSIIIHKETRSIWTKGETVGYLSSFRCHIREKCEGSERCRSGHQSLPGKLEKVVVIAHIFTRDDGMEARRFLVQIVRDGWRGIWNLHKKNETLREI